MTCCGSRASRRPSPMKLIATTVTKIARPGKTAVQGAIDMSVWASFSMFPQLGVGGWIPSPRNERVLSAMMAVAIPSVAATMMGASALGSRCLVIIRRFDTASALAASTNWRSLSERKLARISLDTPIHESAPSRSTTVRKCPPKNTENRMSRNRRGNEHHVHEAHQHRVRHAAVKACQPTEHDAQRDRDGHRQHPDRDRDPATEHDSGQQVSAQAVCAHDVPCRRWLVAQVEIGVLGVVRRQDGADQYQKDEQQEHR